MQPIQPVYFEFDEEERPEDAAVANEFANEIENLKIENPKSNIILQPAQNQNPSEVLKKPLQIPMLKMKFITVCRFYEKVSQVRGKKKSEIVQMFLEGYAFKEERNPRFVYTLLRLLLPFYDRDRGVYKLQEKAIAKLFHQALGLPDSEYQRMANYKHASLQPYGAPVGDFPSVVHSVVGGFCPKVPTISIQELDELLDELVQATDTKGQVSVVTRLIQRCTGDELIWVVRVILKDLKIGLKHEKVLDCYHPDAIDYYNATSSLREVCKEFEDRTHTLKNVLRLFHPIKPMLAAKRSPKDIKNLCEGKEFVIETKYDGERIQCHFTPEQMRFFTRNANDYTNIYGPKMTDIIRQCVNAHSAILDGEIVVVDKITGQQVQFGLNKPVAREGDQEEGEYRLCYKIFDILYVRGFRGEECNMMNLKLIDRRKVLKRVVKTIPMHVELVDVIETSNFDDIITAFDQAVLRSEEGIIIKQLDSEYHPNDRSTKWVKMKGDYLEGLTDTFDVLIIGGFFGEESLRTDKYDQLDRITHFLLGVAAKIDRQNPQQSLIYPFCKVGTGYTVVELQTIRNKLRPHLVIREGKFKPMYVPGNWVPGVQDRPDVYVDSPANSLILELKAAEIIRSNTFPTDYTLRFPRTQKVRWDKDWHEVLTLQELSQMITATTTQTKNINQQRENNNDSGGSDDEIADNHPEKYNRIRKAKGGQPGRRIGEGGGGGIRVMREFVGADLSNIQQESDIFNQCVFYLANVTSKSYDKHYLEQLITMHGGQCVQNFILSSVTHFISSIIDFRVQTIIDKFPVTVLKPEWIIECVRTGKISHYHPRFVIYAQDWVKEQQNFLYDKYGDSYFEELDQVQLKDIMDEMEIEEVKDPQLLQLQTKYEKKYLSSLFKENRISLLYGKKLFIWVNPRVHQEYDVRFLKAKLEARGAIVINNLKQYFDYMVILPNNEHLDNKQIEVWLEQHPNTKTTNLENLSKIFDQI